MKANRKRLLKKFLFVAIAATLLAAMAATVYASTIYYHGRDTDGWTHWTSCGSSAGNSSWACPPDGGPCVDETDYRTDQFCNLSGEDALRIQ